MSTRGAGRQQSNSSVSEHLDKAGMTASLLCAVHCAVMPIAIALLPIVGLSILADSRIEWMLVGSAALLGTTSLAAGYRQHRSAKALLVLFAGLSILISGRLFESYKIGSWAIALVVAGGITVAFAHAINLRLCRDGCFVPSQDEASHQHSSL